MKYYFYDKKTDIYKIENKFNNIIDIDQIHSDNILEVNSDNANSILENDILDNKLKYKADAIITKLNNIYLLIRTADCVPLLLYDGNYISAIHLGYKSLFKNLLFKILNLYYCNSNYIYAYIGPHIHINSYQIDSKFLDLFYNFYNNLLPSKNNILDFYSKDKVNDNKFFFNLNYLIKFLLEEFSLQKNIKLQIKDENIDVFTNNNYHSYRRYKKNNMTYEMNNYRNYSIISK